jgi:hypothetical protein
MAGGGIVAFSNRGLVEGDSSDDTSGFTFSTGTDPYGNDVTAPASQFILGNQPTGIASAPAPAPAPRTQPTPSATTKTAAADPTTAYFGLLEDQVKKQQEALKKEPESVADIMAEYKKYKKEYGIGAATDALNERLDEMENQIAAKNEYAQRMARAKAGFAMMAQASKSGQAGNDLNKFLAALGSGGQNYAESMVENERTVEAQKQKLFDNRLAITKASEDEREADLRTAMTEHKSQVTQHVADANNLSRDLIALAKERSDYATESKRMAMLGNSSTYRTSELEKLQQRYVALKSAGKDAEAQKVLETMKQIKTALTDPTGAGGDKYNAAALQSMLKSAQTELQQATFMGNAEQQQAAQDKINDILLQIQTLGSGGSGIGTMPMTDTSGTQFLGFK